MTVPVVTGGVGDATEVVIGAEAAVVAVSEEVVDGDAAAGVVDAAVDPGDCGTIVRLMSIVPGLD